MLHGTAFVKGGFRPVIVKQGHKWNHVVYNDGSNVRVHKTKEVVSFRPLRGYENCVKLARRMLRPRNCLGVKKDITKGARRILREVTA